MKKITFKNIYECLVCKHKIRGYATQCPICKTPILKKVEDNKLTTKLKGQEQ